MPDDQAQLRSADKGLDPQRLIRIANVTQAVLQEARHVRPEAAAMERLREIHSSIREELRRALPDDLYQELDRLTPELRDGSKDEMELAHASLLGWLTGLFQGTQVALQMQAGAGGRQELRRPPGPSSEEQDEGRYL